jgi:hypothetical protein
MTTINPLEIYNHATNPNIPAVLAQVDLNRCIAANSALNRDDLRQAKIVAKTLSLSTKDFSTISWR